MARHASLGANRARSVLFCIMSLVSYKLLSVWHLQWLFGAANVEVAAAGAGRISEQVFVQIVSNQLKYYSTMQCFC